MKTSQEKPAQETQELLDVLDVIKHFAIAACVVNAGMTVDEAWKRLGWTKPNEKKGEQ